MKAKLSITLAASLFFSGSVYADGNITGSVFHLIETLLSLLITLQ